MKQEITIDRLLEKAKTTAKNPTTLELYPFDTTLDRDDPYFTREEVKKIAEFFETDTYYTNLDLQADLKVDSDDNILKPVLAVIGNQNKTLTGIRVIGCLVPSLQTAIDLINNSQLTTIELGNIDGYTMGQNETGKFIEELGKRTAPLKQLTLKNLSWTNESMKTFVTWLSKYQCVEKLDISPEQYDNDQEGCFSFEEKSLEIFLKYLMDDEKLTSVTLDDVSKYQDILCDIAKTNNTLKELIVDGKDILPEYKPTKSSSQQPKLSSYQGRVTNTNKNKRKVEETSGNEEKKFKRDSKTPKKFGPG